MRQAIHRFSERDLRDALKSQLADESARGVRIVEEMVVEQGGARIDVAVLGPAFAGFEIKSDYDTLDRLAHQMHAYHHVFDRLTLVTSPAFVDQVRLLLPKWWGIWVARRSEDGQTGLCVVREADTNPRQDPISLASLLWRDEALALLALHSDKKISTHANRAKLAEGLAALTDTPTLRDWVVTALSNRTTWRQPIAKSIRSADQADAPFAPDGDWPRLVATL